MREVLPSRLVILAGASALAIFAVATLVAWLMTGRPGPDVGAVRREEIDMVEQRPFSMRERGEARLAPVRARLISYGWSDRDAGLVHVPLSVAVDQLIEAAP